MLSVQLLRCVEVFKVFVVHPDFKLTWGAFKEVLPLFKSSYWGHKISKSTSVDCNKIYVVMVKSKKIPTL